MEVTFTQFKYISIFVMSACLQLSFEVFRKWKAGMYCLCSQDIYFIIIAYHVFEFPDWTSSCILFSRFNRRFNRRLLGWQQRGSLYHVSFIQSKYFLEVVKCEVNLMESTVTHLRAHVGQLDDSQYVRYRWPVEVSLFTNTRPCDTHTLLSNREGCSRSESEANHPAPSYVDVITLLLCSAGIADSASRCTATISKARFASSRASPPTGSYCLTATIPTLFADSSSGSTDEHSVY
jgi:hypothetical protein